ncbi:hypothetical protein Krac_1831 [Ktedonobacter racemifer DSM 44963]|uniref:Uncharacterized protein n=1 Tax=Ktedonobacter racemifer DSM 44963 TaxID=485913 RepID=D6U3D5_KTERA|nr:hypothetical protein Krac_1831 [Ktedonobacter racemifer DSM 44963]
MPVPIGPARFLYVDAFVLSYHLYCSREFSYERENENTRRILYASSFFFCQGIFLS